MSVLELSKNTSNRNAEIWIGRLVEGDWAKSTYPMSLLKDFHDFVPDF